MQKHSISAYRISKMSGISESTLSRWLNGKSDIKKSNYQKNRKGFKIMGKQGKYLNYIWGENIISAGKQQHYIVKLDPPAVSIRFNYREAFFLQASMIFIKILLMCNLSAMTVRMIRKK